MMNKLTIYSRETECPWCVKAVALARKHGIDIDYIVADTEELKVWIREVHGSVPYILEGKRVIGGFKELLAELEPAQ